MSLTPARIFGLPAGTLAPGSPADFVLIDPGATWQVDPMALQSMSRNTPFAGRRLRGRAAATFVEGRRAFALPSFTSRETKTGAP